MSTSKEALFPDKAYISIGKRDNLGSEISGETQISSMSISGFGRDTDYEPFFGDAKIKILKPQEDGEISFDVAVTNEQWDQMFWGGSGSDFTSGSNQEFWRVSFLVTTGSGTEVITPANDDSGSASGAIGSTVAYRLVYADCNVTAFEPAMESDSYLKGSITFKVTPTDESGLGNVRIQTLEGAGPVAALGTYTSSTKW